MNIVRDIAAGLAASAIFALIEHFFLPLGSTWKLLGLAITFAVAFLVAMYVGRSRDRLQVMSGVDVEKDMRATLRNSELHASGPADILSGNKVKGDADYTVEDVRIRRE